MLYNRRYKSKLYIRKFKESLFRLSGILSIVFAVSMLVALLYSIFSQGSSALFTSYAYIEIDLAKIPHNLDKLDSDDPLYDDILKTSLQKMLIKLNYKEKISNLDIFSSYEGLKLQHLLIKKPKLKGKLIFKTLLDSQSDMYYKGYISEESNISLEKEQLLQFLKKNKIVKKRFNSIFFSNADSRSPELAGIKGALLGTIYTTGLTLLFSLIISVGTAIYLEEFAKKGVLLNLIEVNINNLAAVPSIVFGLLGLIAFEQFLGVPRSTPLLASLVLTLMSLPTIIITSRIAISNVPNSIKEAAYGLGSSKIQVIAKHILPISLPGILTGVIIAISRAIGETAPLLMIGMVAFINTVPSSILAKSTVLPVQILLWSDSPEIGYIEKASLTIMLLLIFLIFINWLAIYLRNKFETKF